MDRFAIACVDLLIFRYAQLVSSIPLRFLCGLGFIFRYAKLVLRTTVLLRLDLLGWRFASYRVRACYLGVR